LPNRFCTASLKVAELQDRVARVRRLAVAFSRNAAAPRLIELAEELEAEIARLSRLE
jgi:hypothetical protein